MNISFHSFYTVLCLSSQSTSWVCSIYAWHKSFGVFSTILPIQIISISCSQTCGCGLWVIFLLEDELSLYLNSYITLVQVFIEILHLVMVIFSAVCFPVPATGKHPHSLMGNTFWIRPYRLSKRRAVNTFWMAYRHRGQICLLVQSKQP